LKWIGGDRKGGFGKNKAEDSGPTLRGEGLGLGKESRAAAAAIWQHRADRRRLSISREGKGIKSRLCEELEG